MEKIQTGKVFIIRNIRSGTVIDIGTDHKSVGGTILNNGPNQKWTTTWTGRGWTLRSGGTGQYLGISGPPVSGTRLVATSAPFEWHIWHDEVFPGVYRVFVPGTTQNLDLYNYGDLTPGTPITLWNRWNGPHQLWDFTPVGA